MRNILCLCFRVRGEACPQQRSGGGDVFDRDEGLQHLVHFVALLERQGEEGRGGQGEGMEISNFENLNSKKYDFLLPLHGWPSSDSYRNASAKSLLAKEHTGRLTNHRSTTEPTSHLLTSHLPTSRFPLPTSRFPLPASSFQLLTSFYLLPITYNCARARVHAHRHDHNNWHSGLVCRQGIELPDFLLYPPVHLQIRLRLLH